MQSMNRIQEINDILLNKIEYQAELKATHNQLEELDSIISGSRFTRWFGTSYLFIKRTLFLLLGIGILIIGLLLVVNPEVLLQDEQFKKELIDSVKSEYAEMAGFTMKNSVYLMAQENSQFTFEQFIQNLNKSFEITIEKELIYTIIGFGVIFIIVALVFFYISRLTNKMRKRNSKISKAESLTQEIIKHYQKTIERNEQELIQLKNYQQHLTNPNPQQSTTV
ncbi:hypothetical protein BST91_05210 [Nonlabens tegetincola]|nr:hypothetical protein BST91_05210 [Nonlabens tegetincola]